MFTDPEIVDYRQVLEGIRGEDLANEIYCQTWDCLEGIHLGWAIRNKSIFLPRLKSLRVMFCDALMKRFPFANCGQLSNGRGMGAQMAFATKTCIKYQGSIPSDKMDKGNKSVDYLMRVLIYEAFRDGGTSSEEWTKDAALKVVEDYIAFFDWSLLCCEGDEKDVNGTSWETMKEQFEKHGGLMLWRGFAVINSAFYAIEYHIASDGKQFHLLEASSRTMKLSHGRTTDDVLSNKLIQIFPLCHANALEMWISNREVFSYLKLLKLDQNLSSYLQPLVGTTIPDGNDTLLLLKDTFNHFIKRAKLDGMSQKKIEGVFEADEILRADKKSIRLAINDARKSSSQAIANGEESIKDLALMLVSDSKLIETCMNKEKIKNEAKQLQKKEMELKEREKELERKLERKRKRLKEREEELERKITTRSDGTKKFHPYEIGDEKAETKTGQALQEGLDVRATKSADTLRGTTRIDGTKKRKYSSSSDEGSSKSKDGKKKLVEPVIKVPKHLPHPLAGQHVPPPPPGGPPPYHPAMHHGYQPSHGTFSPQRAPGAPQGHSVPVVVGPPLPVWRPPLPPQNGHRKKDGTKKAGATRSPWTKEDVTETHYV